MTPRLWFSVSLRVMGVWLLVTAASEFVTLFNVARGLYRPAYTESSAFFTHGFVDSMLALILLKGAPVFAAYFYPSPSTTMTKEGSNEHVPPN